MALSEYQTRRRQRIFGLAIGSVSWGILAWAYLSGVFQTFDLHLLDWRFRLRGERAASDSIAIIAIDDETIRAYKGAWPLPRQTYAVLIDELDSVGVRVVGFDAIFSPNESQDSEYDRLLATMSENSPRAVHAVVFHADRAEEAAQPRLDPEVLEAIRRQGIPADHIPAAPVAAMSPPYAELALGARALGHLTVPVDRDGAIRRQPLLVRYEDRVYASLGLRMIGASRGRTGPPEAGRAGHDLRVGWPGAGTWTAQVDEDMATSIDFAGDRGSFPHVTSMIEVLRRNQDKDWLRQNYENRIVLVGLDSREEASEDVGITPFAAATPLLFVHANVLDNLIRGRFLTRAPAAPYLAGLGILALFLGWMLSTTSIPMTVGMGALAFVVLAGADFALFVGWSLDVPATAALAVVPLVSVATGAFRFVFLERHSRAREADLREGRLVQQDLLPESLVGQTLSHYEVTAKLGGGGFGVVYRARDHRLKRDVAIKVLRGRTLADEKTRRRFRNEAVALSRLSHPHIAAIYDFDSQDGLDFIAMEYVTGMPLSKRVEKGALPEKEAVIVAIQIAEALVEAHAHGVIHRDLKPANVVLTPMGAAKVLDFGLARLARVVEDSATLSESLTETHQIMGTLPYLAPEILRGERATEASDGYALGVILYQMLTGRHPFQEQDPHELYYAILTFRPPAPRVLNARLSEGVVSLVTRAMEKEPSDRFASATEFLTQLRSLLAASRSLVP